MKHPFLILADMDPAELLGSQTQYASNGLFRQVMIVLGALTVAILVAAVGAVLYSKKKKKRKHRHHHHHDHQQRAERPAGKNDENAPASSHGHKSRRRRRRRPHRPMNPTLAQTGGLPPMRDSNTPPPAL